MKLLGAEADEHELFEFADSGAVDWQYFREYDDCYTAKICEIKVVQEILICELKIDSHRSNDDKIFAGIGRKFRIEVGGNVVEVKMGRLVERVCVDVVGCVLEFTLA